MSKRFSMVAGLVLAVGCFGFVGCKDKEAEKAVDSAKAKVSPTGADKLTGVRKVMSGVVENATDKNNFNKMAGYFTAADEDRVNKSKPDTKDLDATIDAFQKAWNAKYHSDFKIKNPDNVYNDAFAKLTVDPANGSKATATVAAADTLPETKLNFVEEKGVWKLAVPGDADGPTIASNLMKTLQELTNGAGTWPDDMGAAARVASHRILMAVTNQSK